MTRSPVAVQRLMPEDRDALLTHFRTLSREDRRLRFGSPVSDVVLERYVNGIDFVRDAVFGVYSGDLILRGVAHVAVTEETAELGVSVLDGHRRRGYGTALFARSTTWARNRRVNALFMHCLSENEVMMHIAAKLRMHVVVSHGEADAHLTLPSPTAVTLIEEWMQTTVAVFDRAIKTYCAHAQRHPVRSASPSS